MLFVYKINVLKNQIHNCLVSEFVMKRKNNGINSPLGCVEKKSKPVLKTVLFKHVFLGGENSCFLPADPGGCWSLSAPVESQACGSSL